MSNPLCSTHTSCPLPKSTNPVPRIMTVVASFTGAAFGSISFNETEASSYTVNTSGYPETVGSAWTSFCRTCRS